MERLTNPLIVPKTGEVLAYNLNPGVTDTQVKTKLGKYEDLEEQCIKENAFGIRLLLEKWKEFFEDIQELAEYRKLKKQGRLLILPCVVGDTVYVIAECENIPTVLDGTLYDSNGSPGTATGYYCPYEDECPHECIECEDLFDCDNFKNKSAVFKDEVDSITITEMEVLIVTKKCRVISQIGEFIFLTKEEAEAALEKMKGEEHE